MADELPPAPSESADEAAKAETIRITLPTKPETPTAKRETVRINLPGKGGIPGVTPKKETTKIVADPAAATVGPEGAEAPQAPAIASRPFIPPPPKPPSQAAVPPGPPKPVGSASGISAPPPKPPTLAGRPTLPMKPGAPPVAPRPGMPSAPSAVRPPGPPAPSGVKAPEPIAQRAAAPKKETARITLPAEGAKPALPKATVKMQQTQPLVRQPSASTIQAAPMIQTSPTALSTVASAPASDGLLNVLAIIAFIVSIGAAVLAFLAYSTSQLS